VARRGIRRALLKADPKDPQAELVYFWENTNFRALFYAHRIPLAQAQKIARAMARYCQVPEPQLSFKRLSRRANTAEQSGPRMWVNTTKAGWTHMLLAHEVAHWVCEHRHTNAQDHGPAWMRVYLQLLDRFKVLPLHVTTHSARLFGIKFKDPRC